LVVGIIIQARVDSNRFPAKVLKKILDRPMLWHVIERCKNFRNVDQVALATSTRAIDDDLILVANNCEVDVYRGSVDDVLDRYYRCASVLKFDTIVRITADCPLIDVDIGSTVIDTFSNSDLDYVRTGHSFPDGLSVEVFSFNALERTWKNAKRPSEREHVTPYMINNPEVVTSRTIEHSSDLSGYRFTVDYQEDLIFVTKVYEELYSKNRIFGLDEILHLLKTDAEIFKLMPAPKRNEGYKRSLEEDKKYLESQSSRGG
jgi:spore coat polysaccharide biosynthesis protein SpsF (cytidylyltransferase family)